MSVYELIAQKIIIVINSMFWIYLNYGGNCMHFILRLLIFLIFGLNGTKHYCESRYLSCMYDIIMFLY